MTTIKKYLLLAAVWVVPLLCFGQAQISDVRFEQKGEEVIINYYLDLRDASKVKNVTTYMSLDGGQTYKQLKKVSGDVGTVRKSGEKQITFDIFKEFGDKEISGDIKFKVEGKNKYPIDSDVVKACIFYGVSFGAIITGTVIGLSKGAGGR
jgi:hypothetical protein